MLKRLRALLLPGPERKALAADFRDELHKQASVLHIPGGAISAVAWLGFALDTDKRLHPEFTELIYFRLALSGLAALLLLVVLHDRLRGRNILRGRGLGWMYVLVGYVLLATAFFTGRIADDPNYVSGLQIVIMLVVFVPFPRRVTYSMYGLSVLLFVGSVALFRPDLSTFKAQYSMQNLGIALLLSLIMTFILDRYRFNIFANHRQVVMKSRQVEEQMAQVRTLKEQQDGDYFLTANLIKPLIRNDSTGGPVHVQFLLDQKKKFTFRTWSSEIGGDYLYADRIVLGNSHYAVVINGDAMGKSVQGAGGALVLGTVFRSLLTRTEHSPVYQAKSPERWLKDAFVELQDVFVTFDGTMLISCVFGLIEEKSGMFYFINAEHPDPVLLRSGKASFLETQQVQRKLGTQGVESKLRIQATRLLPEDVVVLGSDGRDDLLLSLDENGNRVINEDEQIFRGLVESEAADLEQIVRGLEKIGPLTDDLSLMRISYREDSPAVQESPQEVQELRAAALAEASDPTAADGAIIERALARIPEDAELLAAAATYYRRRGNLRRSCELYEECSRVAPESTDALFHTAAALRRLFRVERNPDLLERAVEWGERLRLREPGHAKNLLQLADNYRLMGNVHRARQMLEETTALTPDDANVLRLSELLAQS